MNILVSAFSCIPHRGSEPGVGWNFIKEMSSRHEVTALVRRKYKESILSANEPWMKRVQWEFIDPEKTFWTKDEEGVGEQMFYLQWQKVALQHTMRLLETKTFDLAHHITFGKYWVPSLLPLSGIPTVFGPVGGGETFPRGYFSHFSWKGRGFEILKRIMSTLVSSFPLYRRAYKEMVHALATTSDSRLKLMKLVNCQVEVVPQSGLSRDELDMMDSISTSTSISDIPKFVTASRLNHWKAIDIAVAAFAEIVPEFPSAQLVIIGQGPEEKRIGKMVSRLKLTDHVKLIGRLPNISDVYREMASATAFIHSALHEAFGQACVEALALQTPVICFDHAGPGLIVDSKCGIPVTPSGCPRRDIHSFAEAMKNIAATPEQRKLLGKAGRAKVEDTFLWESIVDVICRFYGKYEKSNDKIL